MTSRKGGLPQAQGQSQLRGHQSLNPHLHRQGIGPAKTVMASQAHQQPIASPVYRPQAGQQTVQPAMAQTAMRNPKQPVAPPIYRQPPVPGVLQRQTVSGQQSQAGQPTRQPAAPPVYRPQPAAKTAQPKMANPVQQNPKQASAPPVYRPQPTPRVLQTKSFQTRSAAPAQKQSLPGNRVVSTTVQRMSVRAVATASTLSGPTATKHVEPAATQQARANAEYGSRTFVLTAAAITDVVDANNHNFVEANGIASARFNFNAMVPVSVYMKTPPDLGAGHVANRTVDNTATNCQIGVEKKGDDTIKVTHFKVA